MDIEGVEDVRAGIGRVKLLCESACVIASYVDTTVIVFAQDPVCGTKFWPTIEVTVAVQPESAEGKPVLDVDWIEVRLAALWASTPFRVV